MKSIFEPVYAATRSGNFSAALRRLLGIEKKFIQKPYSNDLNHAWYLVGDIYYKVGDIQKALQSFKRSLQYCPEDWQAMMAIANCYSEEKKPRWAVFYLEKAIKCESKHAGLYYNLGNAYFDSFRYREAIKSYEMAQRLGDPSIKLISRDNLLLARTLNKKLRAKVKNKA